MNYRFERKNPNYTSPDAMLIWHPSQRETYYDKPKNSWCMFRKNFTLTKKPIDATVKIFADTRYLLYINGIETATGPCRSDPRWQYYDEINITNQLTVGENCIAVLVLYLGYGTGQSINRIPALYADVKINADTDVHKFSTDNTWKCKILEAHNPNAPRVNGCKGNIEIFDNRLYDENWNKPKYDDDDWCKCHQRDAKYSPFWNIQKKKIPMLYRKSIYARNTVCEGNIPLTYNKKYDISHLHYQIMHELNNTAFSNVIKNIPCVYKNDNRTAHSVIADFGKIYVGTPVIEAEGSDGDIIDIVYAEELFDNKPHFDGISYRPIARFILKEGKNTLPIFFGYEAFRYLTLILRSNKEIRLSSISALTREYPFDKKAEFKCENEKMNRLWDISTHTLEICLQDGYLDSPSREQQQWMGDARFQSIMNYYYSGDTEMTEKLLLQFAQSQDFEGMTASRYPDENHNFPPIPSYCLQWLCAFSDWYKYTGKTELIYRLYPCILNGIRWFSAFEGDDGLLYDVPYWGYYDMGVNCKGKESDFYRGGSVAFLDMQYAEAMQSVALCAKLVGDSEAEEFFNAKRERLITAIKNRLWNFDKNAYADCIVNGHLSDSVSESVNALAIIGFEKGERAEAIFNSVFCPETRYKDTVEVGIYLMILLLRALKCIKKEELSVQLFLERYNTMIEHGAETTWEHWWLYRPATPESPEMFSSACHAWGASAIVLVAENILGINPEQHTVKIPDKVSDLLGKITATVFLPGDKRFTTK